MSETMCKILRGAAFLLAIPAAIHSEEPELRNSVFVLGGTGSFSYRLQPDQANAFAYQWFSSAFAVSPTDPLKILADREVYGTTRMEGSSTSLRLMFEHLMLDSGRLGLTGGLSHATVTEKCVTYCGDFSNLLVYQTLAQNGGQLPGSNAADYTTFSTLVLDAMLGLAIRSNPSVNYSYDTLDVGLNFHFSPGALMDPYIGANLGGGSCQVSGVTGGGCTAAKYGARLGARIKAADAFFLIAQGEWDRVQLTLPSGAGITPAAAPDRRMLIGFGINFK